MDDYSDDDLEMIDCAACGESIYEEAESCHHCGEFVVRGSSFLSKRKPWIQWIWVLVVVVLVLQMLGMLF